MPSVVVNNTAQVRLIWQYKGSDVAVNVIHGIKDDPLQGIDQARAQGVCDNITNALNALVAADKANWQSQWKLASVGVRDIDQPNNVEYIASPAVPFAGTNGSELLPLNVASCVTLRTDKAGASFRGRFYVSGWTEAGSATDGLMTAAARSGAVNLVTAIRDGLDASGFTMAVASRVLGTSRAVTSILSRDNVWDTQRRRIVPGI